MTDMPNLNVFTPLPTFDTESYRSYLPNAFDDNLSLLQKVNQMISYLNQIGALSNGVVGNWNEVMSWLEDGGISQEVTDQLTAWKNDGTLDTIINQNVFGDINTQLNQLGVNVLYPPAPMIALKGDGVTDDTSALKNILTNYSEIFIPKATYVISTTITLDSAKHKIKCDNAIFDYSPMTTGSALYITNTNPNIAQNFKLIKGGLQLVGKGLSVTGIIGVTVGTSSGNNVSNIEVDDLNIKQFETGFSLANNAYLLTFNNLSISECTTDLSFPNSTNAGERINFINSIFANSTNSLNCGNPNADINFIGCSFDYFSNYVMNVSAGHIRTVNCHFESDGDGDYWFILDGSVSGCQDITVIHDNPEIVGQGTRTKPFAHVDSSCQWGGLILNNPFIKWRNLLRCLIDGLGTVKINHFATHPTYNKMPISEFLSVLPDNGFNGKLNGWTTGGVVPPTIDTTTSTPNGKDSVLFKVTSDGQDSNMLKDFTMQAGQILSLSHLTKTVLNDSTHPFSCFINFYDDNGDIITNTEYAHITTSQDWSLSSASFLAPKGTVKAEIGMNTGLTLASNNCWVNDMIVNVI